MNHYTTYNLFLFLPYFALHFIRLVTYYSAFLTHWHNRAIEPQMLIEDLNQHDIRKWQTRPLYAGGGSCGCICSCGLALGGGNGGS